MWHEIFNSLLVGVGGLCVWVFKYHYQRFMAAHDLQRKADAEWRAGIDSDIAELKRITGTATGKGNSVDRPAGDRPHHGRDRLPDR